jgi:hypothetical protein
VQGYTWLVEVPDEQVVDAQIAAARVPESRLPDAQVADPRVAAQESADAAMLPFLARRAEEMAVYSDRRLAPVLVRQEAQATEIGVRTGAPPPDAHAAQPGVLAAARARLGGVAFAVAWADRAALSVDAAVAGALGAGVPIDQPGAARTNERAGGRHPTPLSPPTGRPGRAATGVAAAVGAAGSEGVAPPVRGVGELCPPCVASAGTPP